MRTRAPLTTLLALLLVAVGACSPAEPTSAKGKACRAYNDFVKVGNDAIRDGGGLEGARPFFVDEVLPLALEVDEMANAAEGLAYALDNFKRPRGLEAYMIADQMIEDVCNKAGY